MSILATKKKPEYIAKAMYTKTAPPGVASDFPAPVNVSVIQRKAGCVCGGSCPCCKEDLDVQRKARDKGMKAGIPTVVSEVLNTPGRSLDHNTKSFMESRFGHDFSGVRVHTSSQSALSAESIQARAYTHSNHIVFGSNEFAPETDSGKRLLAHELTHVVQQSGGVSTKLKVGSHDDSLEQEADRVAETVMTSSEPVVSLQQNTGVLPSIQRERLTDYTPVYEDEFLPSELNDEPDLKEVEDGDSPPGPTIPIREPSDTQFFDAEEDEVDGDAVFDEILDETSGSDSEVKGFALSEAGIQMKPNKNKKKIIKNKKKVKTIKKIVVDLTTQKITIQFSDPKIKDKISTVSTGKGLKKGWKGGNTKTDRCASPGTEDSQCTPTGNFKAGTKGGANYKNSKGDKMSWYVEITGSGADNRGIGFHDSQVVNGTPLSHGCIRVKSGIDKLINKGITSTTKIEIKGKANIPADERAKKAARKKAKKLKKSGAGNTSSSTNRPTDKTFKYKIQAGDSISQIARKFGVDEGDLLRANGIKKKDKHYIKAGDSLKIPAKK